MSSHAWQVWVDRGGTFTDVIAYHDDFGVRTCKLLSDNSAHYNDAIIAGIRKVLQLTPECVIDSKVVSNVRIGTTIATNALLERHGSKTALITSAGFADCLRIAYQQRPNLFALHIEKPDTLYAAVIETTQRRNADGELISSLNIDQCKQQLIALKHQGIRSVAIAFMHAYKDPNDELTLQTLAQQLGFDAVICSHQIMRRIGLIARGQTAVVEAYLAPLLHGYLKQLEHALPNVAVELMQSNGGLLPVAQYQAKDSLLSGPAGGLIAGMRLAQCIGAKKIITFDMGGTSTDVGFYDGELHYQREPKIAGLHLHIPCLEIDTIAAGGGSIIQYQQGRFVVGPESAGANPGPACYRRGGPLTLTDCHVLLGHIDGDSFPACFGECGTQPIDGQIVQTQFDELTNQINQACKKNYTAKQIAQSFIDVAILQMAAAIKKLLLKWGQSCDDAILCCFGGAGPQHACQLADALEVQQVVISPYASLFSAVGIGLADQRSLEQQTIEQSFTANLDLETAFTELHSRLERRLEPKAAHTVERLYLKYPNSDSSIAVRNDQHAATTFHRRHQQRCGYSDPTQTLVCEAIEVERIQCTTVELANLPVTKSNRRLRESSKSYNRCELSADEGIKGPARIIETNTVTLLDESWQAMLDQWDNLVLRRSQQQAKQPINLEHPDPKWLEVFNHAFMSVAEQMGEVLINTARSVNIKERHDFSCALFDENGGLIANAPHMPVHLGSMSESVKVIMQTFASDMKSGDAFMLNDPFNGGTHLPDVTVVTPYFATNNNKPDYFLACRGHHADIGGIEPGSMPAYSTSINMEGIIFEPTRIMRHGTFDRTNVLQKLQSGENPALNPIQNVADLQAQIAANQAGINLMSDLVEKYGRQTVARYVEFVNDNAADVIREALKQIHPAEFSQRMDCGAVVTANIKRTGCGLVCFDFSRSHGGDGKNFYAPRAVTVAAVLYVIRCLASETIPLNQGCLTPIQIIYPDSGILNPQPPNAVVAGNVETSQNIVEALFSALGIMAQSQATMNNLTFGNSQHQYYETIAGGSGAGPGFDGCDAVQVHMTNTRLTDPEVLEYRFPVLLRSFSIRQQSGGNGLNKGGNGVTRCIEFLEPMHANILSEHRHYAPLGMRGGGNGEVGNNSLLKANGETIMLSACASVQLEKGDRIKIVTPGGGGFGQSD